MNEFIKAFKILFIITFIIILILFGVKAIISTDILLDLSKMFICCFISTFFSTCMHMLFLEDSKTKFTKMSKEEHDKTKIDVYDYIIK